MPGLGKILRFETPRLTVQDWAANLGKTEARQDLQAELAGLLTPKVMEHLPPSFLMREPKKDISAWVSARHAEGTVLQINQRNTEALLGLVFLSTEDESSGPRDVHIGYLLAETIWGQGYGTELLKGLVVALAEKAPIRLLGGVDHANPASARVLVKAGFKKSSGLSNTSVDFFVLDIS